MPREISLAHSRSILDRQRHVMSIGLENQALFHYDINSNDALDRYQLSTSILSPLKWEFISGSPDNVTVNNDGSILITGVTGSFIIAGADYIEIQPDPKYYLSLIMMNINDSDESHTVSVGTINYTDLDTKITQGRPSGIDYDNWVIDGDSVNFDDSGNNVIQWHTYVNNAIMVYEYKSGESGTPTELHKWPPGIRYARIFIKITNLVPADQIMIRDLNMFFRDDDGTYTNITPGHTIIDSFDGKFGGGMDMSGGGINLVWNGDLRYGAANWSVGTQGSGSVIASLDDDGSYKVYFREVQDVKNIIQIDMPQDIVDSIEYTISFYARAAVPIGFRRISVIDPATQNVGWVAEKIIYIDNTWRKFTATATSDFATGAMSRLVITEPDLLEPETLFIYYNGILLTRGTDYVELDDYNLQFDFDTPAGDNDVISIYSQISSSFVSSSYRIIFHSAVPAGNTVAIRHFTEVADPTAVTAMEEIYEISSPTTTVDTGNYVPDTPNYLHVFRNGQLLTETVDYTTSVVIGMIRLSFSYSLATSDKIKVVFWKNMSMTRNNYSATGTLNEQFDLPAGTYTTDAAHMMVFENGILLTEGALNDYIEFDTNTVQYNGTPGAGNTISLIAISDLYEFSLTSWTLLSNQAQFAYTPEDTNVFRFVTINGTAMSKDYSIWTNDYDEPATSSGDSFYYERYDLPAVAIPSQTVFPVPGGYDVDDSLQVYRNGILLTLTDDYTKQQPAGTVTLIVPAVVGELMTIFRVITEPGTGPFPTRYIREDYALDEGMTSYNTSQVFAVGDDSLQIFINGVLQRLGLDYTEDDTNTITLLSPFSTGDTIALLISLPLGSEQASEYSQVTYHGTDVDADNILYTPAVTLNYVEDTEGTVWIKNVKLGEGKPYADSYHTGTIISGNLEYNINIDELEGTITFQMKPYAIDLGAEGIIDWQGGVANYAALPGAPSTGEVYRTEDTYKYWEWDGSSYDEILGPTVFSLLYNNSWDLFKIERMFGETNKFKAIVGEPNNYSVITIPELSVDDWTMITISWSQFGTQWYQTEYDTAASLPVLTSSEEGYVYKVSDTGYYYIWDGDSWEPKAPNGVYNKYTDLPAYTLFEDGYAAYVEEEPELYQGSVANYASLPVGHSVTERGWIYKTTDTGYYYIWDWDYVEDTGNWRKIIPGYYYQWSWSPSTQSGSWRQSNKIKLYLNGGADGIYTKSYHPVSNQPDGLVITNKFYGKVDELRIDRIARDPKEIAAWNNSQAPFYPSGDVAQIV